MTRPHPGPRMDAIVAHNLFKTYRLGRVDVPVLRGVDLSVAEGEWLAVLGASGSGKSTLLHVLGGLDRPDREPPARVEVGGRSLPALSRRELDAYRAATVGFVFQFYHLLPELTVLENALLAPMIRLGRAAYRACARQTRARACVLLERFGLGARLAHRPAELSGGERQRVAIARALMNDPPVLLADEPTGNLDRATGSTILDVLAALHRERGRTTIMVTHDPGVAARADRVVTLEDGRVALSSAGASGIAAVGVGVPRVRAE